MPIPRTWKLHENMSNSRQGMQCDVNPMAKEQMASNNLARTMWRTNDLENWGDLEWYTCSEEMPPYTPVEMYPLRISGKCLQRWGTATRLRMNTLKIRFSISQYHVATPDEAWTHSSSGSKSVDDRKREEAGISRRRLYVISMPMAKICSHALARNHNVALAKGFPLILSQ